MLQEVDRVMVDVPGGTVTVVSVTFGAKDAPLERKTVVAARQHSDKEIRVLFSIPLGATIEHCCFEGKPGVRIVLE